LEQRRWRGWLWSVRGDQGRGEGLVCPTERFFYGNICHKLIPVAPLRPDHPLRLSTVAHVHTDRPETALQRRIRDGESFPDLFAQFLLGDDTLTMLYEVAEHLKHLAGQLDALTRARQGMETRVENTVSKVVDHVLFHQAPASAGATIGVRLLSQSKYCASIA
jgi:hypothetical protein